MWNLKSKFMNPRQTGAAGFVAHKLSEKAFEDLFGYTMMRALSWKQPFASLMLQEKIETRTWATKYRGPVLICASQSAYTERETRIITGGNYTNAIEELRKTAPRGVAIAVGNLIDCRKMRPEDEAKCFVQYNEALWCHVYSNVKAIAPFEFKGAQGWQKVSEEVKSKIKYL
jgi:hypothetical protein